MNKIEALLIIISAKFQPSFPFRRNFAVLVKLPKDCGEVVFVVSPGDHVQHLPKAVSVRAQCLLQHAKQEEV